MTRTLESFDHLLRDNPPAAIVRREPLCPVDHIDPADPMIVRAPTFAPIDDKDKRRLDPQDKFRGGYNIDEFTAIGDDGKERLQRMALLDSWGSYANRIEVMFKAPPLADLVPQVTITAGSETVNLLDVGHRLADALVRSSCESDQIAAVFQAAVAGNMLPLLRLAPTSIVFGCWDSRNGGKFKMPRLLTGVTRAWDVNLLHVSSQYVPPVHYEREQLLPDTNSRDLLKRRAEAGMGHHPSSWQPGGVTARSIVRTVSLNLSVLQQVPIAADSRRSPDAALVAHRYLLALSLVAFTASPGGYLRQGCHLRPAGLPVTKLVRNDGTMLDCPLSHDDVLAWARMAATAFRQRFGGDMNVEWSVNPDGCRRVLQVAQKASEDKSARNRLNEEAAEDRENNA